MEKLGVVRGCPGAGRGQADSRVGFTLVELLVVIAIIAILIAIAIPVYQGVREQVRQKACMANLYQIANALQRYRVDEGAYPGPYDPVTGQGGLNALYPYYLDNRNALICPDDPIQDGDAYYRQYQQLLDAAGNMYVYNWLDDGFFREHYSSYNALYNYMGYVAQEGDYSLCGYATHHMGVGDSIAFWYEWYRWDPDGRIGAWPNPDRFHVIDHFLHYHLAQQVYWYNYTSNPYAVDDPTRLVDNLGRPLWDMGDAPWNPGYEGWFPYGLPSASFPGLINRNAPDNTIVTRCLNHRRWTTVKVGGGAGTGTQGGHGGMGQTGQGRTELRQSETPRDIVLRLDGSTSLVRGFGYDWARQPR